MQCERLRDGERIHALQSHALVGGATLIDYRGCGLIGGREGSNEPNELPLDPPLCKMIHVRNDIVCNFIKLCTILPLHAYHR